jgi:Tfp pilus assembly protein PilF
MECRKVPSLALVLLFTVVGCTHDQAVVPPDDKVGRITLAAKEDTASPVDPDAPKRIPKPATCVARGNFFALEAAAQKDSPTLQEANQDLARKSYQQAIKIDPTNVPAYRALANLYLDMNDTEHAVATYRTALQVDPKNHEVWFELGMCNGRRRDWAGAIAALSKAVELEPENRQYVNVLGYALARAGRYDDSIACFCRHQTRAQAHYNLARMLEHLEQRELSKQQLQLALQQDPHLQCAQEMLAEQNGAARPAAVKQVGYAEPTGTAQPVQSAVFQTAEQLAPQPIPLEPVPPLTFVPPANQIIQLNPTPEPMGQPEVRPAEQVISVPAGPPTTTNPEAGPVDGTSALPNAPSAAPSVITPPVSDSISPPAEQPRAPIYIPPPPELPS